MTNAKITKVAHKKFGDLTVITFNDQDSVWFLAKNVTDNFRLYDMSYEIRNCVNQNDRCRVEMDGCKKPMYAVNEYGVISLMTRAIHRNAFTAYNGFRSYRKYIKHMSMYTRWVLNEVAPEFRKNTVSHYDVGSLSNNNPGDAAAKEIHAIRSLYSKSECDWKNFAVSVTRLVAIKEIHKPFTAEELNKKIELTWNKLYNMLEFISGIDLGNRQTRFRNKHGMPISKLGIIENDPKIREFFIDAVRRMAISNGICPEQLVNNKEEQLVA